MRKVVVLPQPEGPSSVTKVPASMVIETSSTAVTAPYCLRTFSSTTAAERLAMLMKRPPGMQVW